MGGRSASSDAPDQRATEIARIGDARLGRWIEFSTGDFDAAEDPSASEDLTLPGRLLLPPSSRFLLVVGRPEKPPPSAAEEAALEELVDVLHGALAAPAPEVKERSRWWPKLILAALLFALPIDLLFSCITAIAAILD